MASFTSSKFLLISAALLGLVSASALPADRLFSRQSTTPDGTCGAPNGYICPAASYKCCSQYGWCGDTDDYCGAGCQSAYGSCTGAGTGTTPTTSPTTPPITSPTTPPTSGRSLPGNVPYGQIINSCTVPGVVALTFDDGPYIYTQELLNILAQNNVAATFFINGQNWGDPITTSGNQALLQSMVAAGHQIGSHSWSHPYFSTLSDADITSQMTQVESALISAIGKYPTYMRPPYFDCGASCLSVMNNLGYHIIDASLDTLDYLNTANIQPSRDIFSNAINYSNPGLDSFLVLEHDVHQTTVEQLVQFMIDTLKAKGYRTATVGECLGDPAENWYRTQQ